MVPISYKIWSELLISFINKLLFFHFQHFEYLVTEFFSPIFWSPYFQHLSFFLLLFLFVFYYDYSCSEYKKEERTGQQYRKWRVCWHYKTSKIIVCDSIYIYARSNWTWGFSIKPKIVWRSRNLWEWENNLSTYDIGNFVGKASIISKTRKNVLQRYGSLLKHIITKQMQEI